MSKSNKKKQLSREDEILAIIGYVIAGLVLIGFLWVAKWSYFDVYKPEEKRYIKVSRQIYAQLQDEAFQLFKEKGFVYESEKDSIDYACERMRDKYDKKANCVVGAINDGYNIKFKNGATISGFEKPPVKNLGVLVKDVVIDVDGPKGKNTMGIDRVPVRIYSTGRMGGKLSPLNCKFDDYRDFEIEYASVCEPGVYIDFMTENIPFGFDIIQLGGEKGVSKKLSKNIPFLRADCVAFSADMTGASDYCSMKGYYWNKACYYDYYCTVELNQNK